ncbi:hypothetical protein ACMXYQ_08285 [Neptuniibacter sp. PT34_22]|uniref:hypothetical protein n=1 Tax=Neptuniibacter sp. PT34_22 TaxID=3398205 RepID=UPI0039F62301
MQLDLQLGEAVQGSVVISERNLMLVFQVNCPGCLSRALPMLSKISEANEQLNCFALSTAFENFNLNNAKTTEALLKHGDLTLHSKRYFAQLGQQRLPYQFDLPVIMDWFMPAQSASKLSESIIDVFDEERLTDVVKQSIKNHLAQRLVPMSQMGRTFLNNDFQGTPTWVYFDKNLTIIDSWFGHKDISWIQAVLDK